MLARFCLAAAAALVQLSVAADDYSQWPHYREITVTTTGSSATDLAKFPLLVRLGADQADVFSQSKARGADLRFATAAGVHLPYQIDSWDSAGKAAAVWVRPDLKGNSQVTLKMYWGKEGAGDSASGPTVFGSDNGYLGVWHLSPSLGDAAGVSSPAVDHGSADAAGTVGRCRNFNGTSAWVDLGKAKALAVVGPVTLQAWVRWLDGGTSGTLNRRHILTHGMGSNGMSETALRLIKTNYYTGSYNSATKTEAAATSPIAGDSAAWVQVAGTYGNGGWKLYRNGVQTASKDTSQGALASDSSWFLGCWGGTVRFFSGDIDEARVSNVPRSADWLKMEYATQKPGQTAVVLGPTQTVAVVPSPRPERFARFVFTAPGTRLSFDAPQGNVEVTVSDLAGRVLWSATGSAGQARWDGLTGGRRAPAGRYILQVTASAPPAGPASDAASVHREIFTAR